MQRGREAEVRVCACVRVCVRAELQCRPTQVRSIHQSIDPEGRQACGASTHGSVS